MSQGSSPEGWNLVYAYGRRFLGVYCGVKLIQISSLLPSRLVIGTDGDLHRLLSSRAVRLFRLVCIVTKNSCWRRHVRLSTISAPIQMHHEIWYWELLRKFVEKVQLWFKSGKNIGHVSCVYVSSFYCCWQHWILIKALSSCHKVSGCWVSWGGINIIRTRLMSRDTYTACLALI